MMAQLEDATQWHLIFAWFPHTTIDGQSVWLEPLERRYLYSSWFDDYFEYRIPASAIERAETAKTGSVVDESAIPKGDAPCR